MQKSDLEQMYKDLFPTTYKNGIRVQELMNDFLNLNSTSAGSSTRLSNLIGEYIYENKKRKEEIYHYSKGLKNIHENKKALLEEIKKNIEIIEREVTLQQESLGNYMEEFKKVEREE